MFEAKKFASLFIQACIICPVKWVPPSLEIVKDIPLVGNICSNPFFTVRASALPQGKATPYPENTHTIMTTYWLVIHAKWQPNEVAGVQKAQWKKV